MSLLATIAGTTGRHAVAAGLFEKAVKLNSGSHALLSNLGEALRRSGNLEGSVSAFLRAIALKPDHPLAHNGLGIAYRDSGNLSLAEKSFREATRNNPNYWEGLRNLGMVLLESKQVPEATMVLQQALALRPSDATLLVNLGSALIMSGDLAGAVEAYTCAVKAAPSNPLAHHNLGNAFHEGQKFDEAIAEFRRALDIDPRRAETHNSLGVALADIGQGTEAIASFRKAISLKPDFIQAHSSLLFNLNYHPETSDASLAIEHIAWNQVHVNPYHQSIAVHDNDRDPGRRLRIGYVSPDFRQHVIAQFFLPVLENHDSAGFEIFCYSQVQREDANTIRCRESAHHWRDLVGMNDDDAAVLIRADKIDILIDLAMHGTNHRLPVFARKPAPIQATYLAYAGSTGLTSIDYRLSDPYLDPPGRDEEVYSEKTLRLPRSYWCYEPIASPGIAPLPALENGFITFGCLNNFCKINPLVLNTWLRLLKAVPNSRMILHAPPGSSRERIREACRAGGVEPHRFQFVDRVPLGEYLDTYNKIDIALDPFPFGGGTTTCDALWMGVPVVSVAGTRAVGRGGLSILSTLGLPNLVGASAAELIQIATHLAGNLPLLTGLRTSLRERMKDSPLMDPLTFTRALEQLYQEMWIQWSGSVDP